MADWPLPADIQGELSDVHTLKAAEFKPEHFGWEVKDRVATITLNRPERKNPLTFDSYAELRDTFHKLQYVDDVKLVIFTGAGGNFCSGGDVHEIIGPLTEMNIDGLLTFTRMTGDLVKEMRNCPQPRWPAIFVTGQLTARLLSCSCVSAWRDATWVPVRCCHASSGKAAPVNYFIRAA
jgi:hypothetical protein